MAQMDMIGSKSFCQHGQQVGAMKNGDAAPEPALHFH